jgi:beta-alanine degradation protein BauB
MSGYEQVAPVGAFDQWPDGMKAKLETNLDSPLVGSVLVSETDKVRVWHLLNPLGQSCKFHVHGLDDFWTCHSHVRARGDYEDGRITEVTLFPGDTMHNTYARGERLVHSVATIDTTDLLFTTDE